MAIHHAKPGEVVNVGPLGDAFGTVASTTLARGRELEVIRLIVPAGKEIKEHKAKGEIVLHCLEGKVAFTALGETRTLGGGQLLYLPAGEPHALTGIENASLLLTILLPRS